MTSVERRIEIINWSQSIKFHIHRRIGSSSVSVKDLVNNTFEYLKCSDGNELEAELIQWIGRNTEYGDYQAAEICYVDDQKIIAAMTNAAQERPPISEAQYAKLRIGVYRFFWRTGGSSVGVIMQDRDGNLGLTCANWTFSLDRSNVQSDFRESVWKVELITNK